MAAPAFLIDWFKQAWAAIKPDVEAFVSKEFDKWMPKLIEAAITAMDQIGTKIANRALGAAAEGASNIEEQITEAVPGQIDDQLSDMFVRPILDQLRRRWGG